MRVLCQRRHNRVAGLANLLNRLFNVRQLSKFFDGLRRRERRRLFAHVLDNFFRLRVDPRHVLLDNVLLRLARDKRRCVRDAGWHVRRNRFVLKVRRNWRDRRHFGVHLRKKLLHYHYRLLRRHFVLANLNNLLNSVDYLRHRL